MTRLRTLIACLALVTLAGACGGGGGPAGGQPPFFLQTATPVPNAIFVPLDQVFTLTFNKAINPASLVDNALTVTAEEAGAVNGTTVPVDDGFGNKLRWTPTVLLDDNTLHTLRIIASLQSVDGEAIGGATSFNFRTTPEAGPTFLPNPNQLRNTTGDLNVGRQDHRATLLTDGRVLITGGFTQNVSVTDRAEVFSTTTELFTELSDRMETPRATHTATRLEDGRVLICGGFITTNANISLSTASAEIFNPGSNTFSPLPDMTRERAGHAALLRPDGKVLITGGGRLDGTGFLTDLDDAEIFDPATNMFTPHPTTMTHTRVFHGMVDMGGGRFVLAGGSDVDLSSEFYDFGTQSFIDIGSGANEQIRFGPAMAAFASGDVIVAGGDLVGTVMHIFRSTGLVQNTGSGLNRARSNATASLIAPDQILVAGGIDYSRGGFLEASVDLIIEGGLGGSRTFGTDVRFPHGMAFHSATPLASGDILYVGGLNVDGTQPNLRDAFIFELAAP